jgi:hypothetical protein
VNDKPSYLGAFLRHPSNRVALLAAGCIAIFASIPLGWDGLALVAVLAAGAETLAALTVPSLPWFRNRVDRQLARQALDQKRERLLVELQARGETAALDTYQHMQERVRALYASASDSQSALSAQDVEKLEALTVDYLFLCTLHLSLRQRREKISDAELGKRIGALQAQLQDAPLADVEARPLRATLAEYREALNRSRRLSARRNALEATLIAMPDKIEEVYQLVITSPHSSDLGSQLEASLERLRVHEEVAAEFDDIDPVNNIPTRSPVAAPGAARPLPQGLRH